MQRCSAGVVVVWALAAAAVLPSCMPRGLRTISRASRAYDRYNSREQQKAAEEPPYVLRELPNDARPILDEDREWTPRIYARYKDQIGEHKHASSIERLIAAWRADAGWDKPTAERVASTLSTLFADTAGKDLGLGWIVYEDAEAAYMVLASKDRKTLVFMDGIIYDWLSGAKQCNIDKLMADIRTAKANPGEHPHFIGLD